jgi:hypothetical protein
VAYTAPLGTRISTAVARRLQLARALTGKSISRLVDDALNKDLPPWPDELGQQIDSEGTTNDHAA